MSINLAAVARDLKKPIEKVEAAVQLLDDGNTIPFITRFRKDQTGGLNEEQIQEIKNRVTRMRALAERKAFILKSIESQEKLTDELKAGIEAADSSSSLEDLYLPFKPKKQSLATAAKQKGLEPLATDIFEGRQPEVDLATRATDFVRVDKGLTTVDEVIAGVGHILAERFSEDGQLRNELRKIVRETGKISTTVIDPEPPKQTEAKTETAETKKTDAPESKPAETKSDADKPTDSKADSAASPAPAESPAADAAPKADTDQTKDAATSPAAVTETAALAKDTTTEPAAAATDAAAETKVEPAEGETKTEASAEQPKADQPTDAAKTETTTDKPADTKPADPKAADATAAPKKKKKNKKKKKKTDDAFKDFRDFEQPVGKLQFHRTLAMNRGERAGRVKVKLKCDDEKMFAAAKQKLVPADHPFSNFLETCSKDAVTRLIGPSLEREIRREQTEAAEKHAVEVFAHNLKHLLLQSPVRNQRILAIDPGYKRGCSVACLDQGGKFLESGHLFVVGNAERKKNSRETLTELVKKHSIDLIAIGNGAACREVEQLVSDTINENFKDKNLKYAIVNEAGASHYSTSEIGREEMPEASPAIRSAVSIGRRLLDPLSELVKINPANIGVGLYQHDVRAKHLSETLDEVVEFCVNRVGVNVNTASPSLLRYVSGLNQLTARRLFERRQETGPFKNRTELKEVSGFGDTTFVQAAGFLRVRDGDQPLDSTAIHPESYEAAEKIIAKAGGTIAEAFPVGEDVPVKTSAKAAVATPPTAEAPATEPVAESTDATSTETPAEPVKTEAAPEAPAEKAAETTPIVETPENTATEDTTVEAAKPAEEPKTEPKTEAVAETATEPAPNTESKTDPAVPPTPAPVQTKRRLSDEQYNRKKALISAIRGLEISELATETNVGTMMLRDLVQSICKPDFDPRHKVSRPIFRTGILKIDDVKPEMMLDAQVVNVVDFGVFVDIGLGASCLVHVSQLANHYIHDPHKFYAVGDVMKVWVTEVDTPQRRIKLTAIRPGTPKPQRPKRSEGHKPRRGKPEGAGKSSYSGKGRGKPHSRNKDRYSRQNTRRRPAKPVKPISEDMLAGEKPMRSFSDLAQFYDKKTDETKKPKKKDS